MGEGDGDGFFVHPSGCHCRIPGRCFVSWLATCLFRPCGFVPPPVTGDLPTFPCVRPALCNEGTPTGVLLWLLVLFYTGCAVFVAYLPIVDCDSFGDFIVFGDGVCELVGDLFPGF